MTHGIHWLPFVDRILVVKDNTITEGGTYDELMSHDGAFAQFIRTYLTSAETEEEDDELPAECESCLRFAPDVVI